MLIKFFFSILYGFDLHFGGQIHSKCRYKETNKQIPNLTLPPHGPFPNWSFCVSPSLTCCINLIHSTFYMEVESLYKNPQWFVMVRPQSNHNKCSNKPYIFFQFYMDSTAVEFDTIKNRKKIFFLWIPPRPNGVKNGFMLGCTKMSLF